MDLDLRDIFLATHDLSVIEQIFRTSILYFLLFFANKQMGYRQVGILTPYNFLMAAGISHITASRMIIPESRLIDSVAISVVYTALMLFISYGYYKYPSLVSQKPSIIVKKGRIIKENLNPTFG